MHTVRHLHGRAHFALRSAFEIFTQPMHGAIAARSVLGRSLTRRARNYHRIRSSFRHIGDAGFACFTSVNRSCVTLAQPGRSAIEGDLSSFEFDSPKEPRAGTCIACSTTMSKPFKHILVAIDLSPCSAAALRLASQLAEQNDARLDIVHACDDGRVEIPRVEVEQFVSLVLSPAHVALLHVFPGVPREVILNTADELSCDAIVLGTHGRTGRARMLAGSVAESVVRSATCPVVTVRAPD